MSFSMLKYIPEKPLSENKLQEWLDAHLNVMLVGVRGTGKSQIIMEVFNKNFQTRWAYFNGATTDPWIDLIGIPTARDDGKGTGEQILKYVKPADLGDDLEGVYLDESNRCKTATRNALLELIQFKSINGRKFPNLKVVWSSVNPSKEDGEDNDENINYDVEELDAAFLDRFHILVKVPSEPSLSYFTSHFGNMGVNLVEWWKQQPKEAKALISPRRLEYVALHFKRGGDVTDMLPKCSNTKILIKKINGNPTTNKYYELLEEKTLTPATVEKLHELINSENAFEELKDVIVKDRSWEMLDLVKNEEKIDILYRDHSSKIDNYFFNNLTTNGNLYEFMKKKIGHTQKFRDKMGIVTLVDTSAVAPAISSITSPSSLNTIDVTQTKYFKKKISNNSNLKLSDAPFLSSIDSYLISGSNYNTTERRNVCDDMISNFPATINENCLSKYLEFVNLLVNKTQLKNRTDGDHVDGQYCQAFVEIAVKCCEERKIDYRMQSFYSDMVTSKQDYFVTGPTFGTVPF